MMNSFPFHSRAERDRDPTGAANVGLHVKRAGCIIYQNII